ncbi:uncharacterized protein LOC128770101 [Synchiropus splendidus]|uniref:uncharacterized protein LOC128770101 n=1 Tax=Synchiropus splendidus TaxID=270530 RepID=UPI00237D4189|nr:uncharacterized protein LOC128770101 [Synchiropus splendidus]
MGAVYNLLERHRLETFYNSFVQMGVKDERDFLDITDENLTTIGLSQVEKNRFLEMKKEIERLRAPRRPVQNVSPVVKSLGSFSLRYTFPKCPEPKPITDMDPTQNTLEDLMLRICLLEGVENTTGVCLFTSDGMPLSDDPFFNTWSLKDRHIESGSLIYAIFTPKCNLTHGVRIPKRKTASGEDVIKCHVMLRGLFELSVDFKRDTLKTLRTQLSIESGIPEHVLHDKEGHGLGETLESCGFSEESTVRFYLSTFPLGGFHQMFINDVDPLVKQSLHGKSVFLSSLYVISKRGTKVKKLIAHIRKLTGCHPLAQSLHQFLRKNEKITKNQKIAIIEGLYTLFRELLPKQGAIGVRVIEDIDVFENSLYCWAWLFAEADNQPTDHEDFAPIALTTEDGIRFCEPVRVPEVPGVFERAEIVYNIRDGKQIPNSTATLQETSLQRATDVEKVLLSLPPCFRAYDLWIHPDATAAHNFAVTPPGSVGAMAAKLEFFDYLKITPPLCLKSLGTTAPRLVQITADNFGVYTQKDKGKPDMVSVYDCLEGKTHTLDVNMLAASTGNSGKDHTFTITRTPKEAILVLIDTSSSMDRKCYGSTDIRKIDVVKELFDNFASRSMAYDFSHLIGLVKFDTEVKVIHTFTETLETFKEFIRTIEASGTTHLYDALLVGLEELLKVEARFPECRLRILCLTDGNDEGSVSKPEDVASRLVTSGIIVDSVLLGDVHNNMLHGISNATGGCCFKPGTSQEGLKLFEMETVLSLEQRKLKPKLDCASITQAKLLGMFPTLGYDKVPEVTLPGELKSKVTSTQTALKKVFMEKNKRIREELKNLHCEPHPFFRIFPTETDFAFWKILMQGPPDTPYERGVFELYCQFGEEYPVKPPLVRFLTPIYHCNINSVGRICHNIFDRNYNAHITMREILNAVYGLLIAPEPEDPLDSILAEEYLTNHAKYLQEAKKHTGETANLSMDEIEKNWAVPAPELLPPQMICSLTKTMFIDPVKTIYGTVYERKAIELHLKQHDYDPLGGPNSALQTSDLTPDWDMKRMVTNFRSRQIK